MPVVYVNLVGGQDDLVFDGGSMVVGADGASWRVRPASTTCELAVDLEVPPADVGPTAAGARGVRAVGGVGDRRPGTCPARVRPAGAHARRAAEVWAALVPRDRATTSPRTASADVVIGLSGGVDSSLVAAIAADALGADRVHGVLMPSRYSSEHSVADAESR